MKVVFLDIDGVMNTSETWGLREEEGISSECCLNLNYIIENTDAHVVISSSWRLGYTLDELKHILGLKGFQYSDRIIDKTPVKRDTYLRGYEIQAWLDEHPEVTSFVILDDDSDMIHLKPRLVQTSGYRGGLTSEHAIAAVKLMETEFSASP